MPDDLDLLARAALVEDAPTGDLTSRLTIVSGTACTAELIAKQDGVLAGVAAAAAVFAATAAEDGTALAIEWKLADGAVVGPRNRVAMIDGAAAAVLRAERPALNLLGHLSGIATLTRTYVDAAAPAQILCTRKTLPGLRTLEREAVAAGGGTLHRASLSDAILIKDTHVRIAGGVTEAVRRAKRGGVPVEVEVETLEQLDEAIAEGADRILLDNPTPERVRQAIERVGDPMRLEISGGVDLHNVRAFVEAGARVISVGRLTHSAPALDLSLEVIDIHD
ncbi:MAG: carboxylating nicotinate-nucleotide diphosphorylase [Actinomycetota bacterium]